MSFRTLLECLTPRSRSRRTPRAKARSATRRLDVESLEDRCVPAAFISIGDVSVVEGDSGTQNAVVQVTVSQPHSNSVTVNYTTVNGSATQGSDFNAVSGKLTFLKNEMTKSITIPIRGDLLAEPTESFSVRLSNPKTATISRGEGFVTIADNEPRVTIGDASIVEGDSGPATMTFNVYLQYASSQPVHIDYTTADGSATAGSDYTEVTGSLTIPPGLTQGIIEVTVNGDNQAEWDETVQVNLTTPDSYVAITDSVGIGTIYDDEPRIYIYDAYQDYYASTITFWVSLTAPSDDVVTVEFTTLDGYAVAGWDYVATWGTLTFNPGEPTMQAITVELITLDPDPYKYFIVELSNASSNVLVANQWAYGWWYYDYGYYYYDPGYYYYDYGYGW